MATLYGGLDRGFTVLRATCKTRSSKNNTSVVRTTCEFVPVVKPTSNPLEIETFLAW